MDAAAAHGSSSARRSCLLRLIKLAVMMFSHNHVWVLFRWSAAAAPALDHELQQLDLVIVETNAGQGLDAGLGVDAGAAEVDSDDSWHTAVDINIGVPAPAIVDTNGLHQQQQHAPDAVDHDDDDDDDEGDSTWNTWILGVAFAGSTAAYSIIFATMTKNTHGHLLRRILLVSSSLGVCLDLCLIVAIAAILRLKGTKSMAAVYVALFLLVLPPMLCVVLLLVVISLYEK